MLHRLKRSNTAIGAFIDLLDVIAMAISPMAVIGFVALVIIALDGFGEHVQFLRALREEGVETSGILRISSPSDRLASVDFERQENGVDSVFLYTKYYSKATLAGLRDGQMVRVRYIFPPKYESRAVLVDAYGQVKGYVGYLKEPFWPLLFCWGIIVLHPDWLYLGLIDINSSGEKDKQP